MTFLLLLLLSPSLFSFLSLPHGYVHTHTRIDELKKGGSLVYGADEDDEEKGPGRNLKHHTQVLLVDTATSSFDIVYFLLSFSHSSLSPFPLNRPFFLSLSLSLSISLPSLLYQGTIGFPESVTLISQRLVSGARMFWRF
jgi:hypothetical protein